jgi:FkbM family methyltransferase
MRFRYRSPRQHGSRGVTIDLAGASPADRLAEEILHQGTFYEIDLLEYLVDRVPPGGTYVDVGANIGNHTVYFGKFLADHVIAIEPHPDLLPVLRRNLRRNALTNVCVLACAVGARESVGRMGLRQACALAANIGGSHVEVVDPARPESAEAGATPVRVTTLDRALADLARQEVTLVKLDIEGMELDALQGATSLLAKERPQLVIELASPELRSAVRGLLEGFGYEDVGRRFGWTPTYHFIDPRVHSLMPAAPRPARDLDAWRLDRASKEMCARIPEGATYVLIDDDQWWAGLVVDGRRRLPFCERNGEYWGRPAADEAAVRELARLQKAGARFVVVLWPAFWWFEHYPSFGRHLERLDCLLANDRVIIFALPG